MPGDSPAIYQSRWLLLRSSGAVFAGAPSILARGVSVRWSIFRGWCHSNGHSVSRPTLAKVADFLYWLRYTRGLSVSSLRGYRSVLSAVFRFHLPSLSSDPVIRDLLRSFRLSSAERVLRPPDWDLSKVLTYLVSPAFEPLSQASFRAPVMPCQGPPLVSASGQVFVFRSPSPFRVTSAPFSRNV